MRTHGIEKQKMIEFKEIEIDNLIGIINKIDAWLMDPKNTTNRNYFLLRSDAAELKERLAEAEMQLKQLKTEMI